MSLEYGNYNCTNVTETLIEFEFGLDSELDERNEVISKFYSTYPVEDWMKYGIFDDNYLNLINIHWLNFPPASKTTHHILAFLYGILMVIGCSGNLLVVLLFKRCRSGRSHGNYLVLNLAISDFLMMAKTPIFIYNSVLCGPALGNIGCKIYGFIGGLSGTLSIMSLAAIGIERYRVIAHPLKSLKKSSESSNNTFLTILVLWLYSILFSSLPLFGLSNYVSEGYLTSCSFDYLTKEISSRIFIFIFFLGAWFLPMSLLTFSYVSIYLTVVKAEKIDIFNTGVLSGRESFKYRKKKEKYRREIRVAIICSILVGIWLLAWTPYAIVALLGIFGYESYITPLVSAIPALFCKTASCIDPYIYSMSHPKFKVELRKLFNWRLKKSSLSSTSKSFKSTRPPSIHKHTKHNRNHGRKQRHHHDRQKQKLALSGDNIITLNDSLSDSSFKTENYTTNNSNNFELVTVTTKHIKNSIQE